MAVIIEYLIKLLTNLYKKVLNVRFIKKLHSNPTILITVHNLVLQLPTKKMPTIVRQNRKEHSSNKNIIIIIFDDQPIVLLWG